MTDKSPPEERFVQVIDDIAGLEGDRDEIQQRVLDIESSIEVLENHHLNLHSDLSATSGAVQRIEDELERMRRRSAPGWLGGNAWIIGSLCVVIAFVSLLVWRGWASTPTVAIDFSVGEIIGGALIGSAALVAGASYAKKRRDEW